MTPSFLSSIRIFLLLVIITMFLLLQPPFSGATPPTQAPTPTPLAGDKPTPTPLPQPAPPAPEARPICRPDALILLTAEDGPEMRQAIGLIEAQGGCAHHVFPPHALIGFIPAGVASHLTGPAGIAAIYRDMVAEEDLAGYGPAAQQAARIWNRNFIAPAPLPTPVPGAPTPLPLVGDFRLDKAPAGPDQGPMMLAPSFYQTSEFMAGKIAIGIILPESNGATDSSTENWSTSRMDQVVAEIQSGLNWWATSGNPRGNLSFYYDIQRQAPTQYEPISRSSGADNLWISDTMTNMGYTGSSGWQQVMNYLNNIRTTYGTDWAVAVFVVDSLNDADGKFTDGYFGYTNGTWIVMTYDNDGWGVGSMDKVTAHEIGHDFGAADEYCSPGYACCWGGGSNGYLGIPNSNCEAGCDKNSNGVCDGNDANANSNCHNCPSCVQVNCMMRNNAWTLDTPSQEQIGIRDMDGDNILDPVDTIPALSVNTQLPEIVTTTTVAYSGLAEDIPYDSPIYNDVTINFITSVEFELDNDGTWHPGTANDNSFDDTAENFSLATPLLTEGFHRVSVRAVNRVGNTSTYFYDTFTVDSLPPQGSIIINNGATSTTSQNVTLALTASDGGTGVNRMMVANNSNFSGATWLAYNPTLAWQLAGRGSQIVYVRFQDQAGNISATYQDSIQVNGRLYCPVIIKTSR